MNLHRYRDEAMATHFELLIAHDDSDFANGLSHMFSRELERIEDLLSRFRDGSDIVRINTLEKGETILISEECYTCLRQALEIQAATDGLFDVSVGGYMDILRSPQKESEPDELWEKEAQKKGEGKITIHHDKAAITCTQPGLTLDLGGIGKGYAIQHLATILDEMGAENYMISAGGSTVLAKGFAPEEEKWKVHFHADNGGFDFALNNESISSSGFSINGAHIIKRDEQVQLSDDQSKRVWVISDHSALSDALSTACLLMNDEEIRELKNSLVTPISVWKETASSVVQVV